MMTTRPCSGPPWAASIALRTMARKSVRQYRSVRTQLRLRVLMKVPPRVLCTKLLRAPTSIPLAFLEERSTV
jgi:hypothetical protein